jgi:hypothetical protein
MLILRWCYSYLLQWPSLRHTVSTGYKAACWWSGVRFVLIHYYMRGDYITPEPAQQWIYFPRAFLPDMQWVSTPSRRAEHVSGKPLPRRSQPWNPFRQKRVRTTSLTHIPGQNCTSYQYTPLPTAPKILIKYAHPLPSFPAFLALVNTVSHTGQQIALFTQAPVVPAILIQITWFLYGSVKSIWLS